MSLTKATYSMITGAPINVDDYIPAGTDTATTDCAAYINAALTAGSGKTIVFGQGRTYRANSALTIQGDGTKILGRGATINSYATGSGITYALVGTRYPVNLDVEDLSLNAYGVGAYAWRVMTSYSTYRRCSVGIPAVNVSGRGFVLVGDDTNGTGPYYNTFVDCDAQSGSAGLDHIGFSLSASAPNYRAPNANTFIGCRAGSCLKNFVIKGNGNTFVNPISESPAGTGTAFSFQADTPTNCIQNFIFGCYIEGTLVGFDFNANSSGNVVTSAFATGVTTYKADLGTANQVLTGVGAWDMPTGIKFPSTAITDADVLDAYAERNWTPTPTSLTVVGTPSYTGRYIKIGKQVFWTLKVESTTTTASTANTTYFSGLPAAASPAVCAAVSSNVASFGNGYVDTNGRVYTPTWGATAVVYCSGSYEAAS